MVSATDDMLWVQAMEAVRYRSDAVYSKLAKHHSRWGGLVADEISKHFGGNSLPPPPSHSDLLLPKHPAVWRWIQL